MKLVTLNLEGDSHLDVALPFLQKTAPDVLCLQEVFESDAESIAKSLGMAFCEYTPMTKRMSFMRDSALFLNGIALLSRKELTSVKRHTYYALSEEILAFDRTSPDSIDRTIRRVLLTAQVDGVEIGTTHFNWTPDGMPNESQVTAMESFLKTIAPYSSLVLCGDFNIPRGVNPLYEKLVKEFTDAVPLEIRGSIDIVRHRTKNDTETSQRLAGYMVDYIFTRGPYAVSNVRQVCGVSDHCALVGEIARV